MASITATGIGSGLDISGIVSKLTELERLPLQQLQKTASSLQTKLSVYGQIQSRLSALQDAAGALGSNALWSGMKATSSNAAAVTATALSGATPMRARVEVQQLARGQVSASSLVASGATLSDGMLEIQQGSWASGVFVPNGGIAMSVDIGPGQNSLQTIAAKINSGATPGVQAIVVRDSAGERLVLRSSGTGEAAGFQVSMRTNSPGQGQGQGSGGGAYSDMSFAAPTLDQRAQDALLSVDGVPLRSATNTLSESIPGLRLQLSQVTTAPVEVSIEQDRDAVKAQIQKMVDAYNALQSSLASNTRYDAATGSAAALQGDQTAVGMQRLMRRLVNTAYEGQPLQRIQDIGIGIQANGALSIDTSKLESALDRMQEIKALFNSGAGGQDGVAKMLGDFARNAVSADGRVGTRTAALQSAIKRNEVEQTRVNERAARAEQRLLAMYNAMDSKVGRLNSLNSYVSQQLSGLKNNAD